MVTTRNNKTALYFEVADFRTRQNDKDARSILESSSFEHALAFQLALSQFIHEMFWQVFSLYEQVLLGKVPFFKAFLWRTPSD